MKKYLFCFAVLFALCSNVNATTILNESMWFDFNGLQFSGVNVTVLGWDSHNTTPNGTWVGNKFGGDYSKTVTGNQAEYVGLYTYVRLLYLPSEAGTLTVSVPYTVNVSTTISDWGGSAFVPTNVDMRLVWNATPISALPSGWNPTYTDYIDDYLHTQQDLGSSSYVHSGLASTSVNIGAAGGYGEIDFWLSNGMVINHNWQGAFLTSTAPIPEPSTMLLLSLGLADIIGARRKIIK